jgi:enoyl-CoA hydratase/carnithine racemase
VVTTLHPANQYLEIRLNRPAKFNSLDTEMLTLIRDALDAHAAELKGVILSAALGGRAFSAGGDIKHVAALPDAAARVDFLHLEYSVHQRLHALAHGTGPDPQVPVIAVGDGIVMGAGAGLFMAASERLVTERTLFAMPECKIGLVPDAGALHFLRHPATILAPSVGRMLALTGTRLRARDLLYAKLATDFLPAASVPALLDDLSRCPPGEHRAAFDRRRDPSMGGGDALKGLDQGVLEAARGAIDTAFGEEEEEKEEEEEGETGGEEKKDDEEEPPLVFPLNDDGTGSSSSGSTSSSSSSNGVAALVGRLEAARAAADGVVNGGSAGWRTREAAEQALELATEALAALTDDPSACPTSLGATLLAFDAARHRSQRRRRDAKIDDDDDDDDDEFNYPGEVEEMRAIELLLNGRLASRPDFVEGVACTVGDRRKEAPRWAPPRTAAALLQRRGGGGGGGGGGAPEECDPRGSSDGNGCGDGDNHGDGNGNGDGDGDGDGDDLAFLRQMEAELRAQINKPEPLTLDGVREYLNS